MKHLQRLLLVAAFALSACSRVLAPHDFPADEWVVERTGPSEVEIVWNGAGPAPQARVYVHETPVSDAGSSVAAEVVDGRALVRNLPADARPYFALVAPGETRGVVVAERVLPLEGAYNFRDIGGYATSDGRHVRWGRMFRSDDISKLTDADLRYLARLKLRLVCDFRSDAERSDSPDRLPTPAPETAALAISDPGIDPLELRRRVLSGDLGDMDFAELMTDANKSYASRFNAQYRAMFDRLGAADGTPTLLHCTAGKDRTGFGSALLLIALGVPEQTVYDDYLLTNAATASRTERVLWIVRLRSFGRADLARIRPIFEARREYLSAGLAEMRREHGDFDSYLTDALGVDAEKREALRDSLLD